MDEKVLGEYAVGPGGTALLDDGSQPRVEVMCMRQGCDWAHVHLAPAGLDQLVTKAAAHTYEAHR